MQALLAERTGPVGEHVCHERDGGPGDDPRILPREQEHALAERVPLLDGERHTDVGSASNPSRS